MVEFSEIELFEKVKQRDPQAFNELVRHHSPALFNFILRMVRNNEDAQDILQDTFVKVWEKSHQFKGASTVKTWIYKIALNLSYSLLKRRNRWSYTVIEEVRTIVSGSNPVKDAENIFHSELLAESMEVLTPRQKSVLMARVYEDLPFAQISDAIGCSVNAAKVHFHEGKKRIEAYIKERVGDNE